MSDQVILSIIVPVYNIEAFLPESLDSLAKSNSTLLTKSLLLTTVPPTAALQSYAPGKKHTNSCV